MSSSLSGLYKIDMAERIRRVKDASGITDEEADSIYSMTSLKRDVADRMIENVIGAIQLPVGIATNFLINGKEYAVPMAIEEPSVIAAASNAAKMARVKGGFHAVASRPLMVAQIQSVGVTDPYAAVHKLLAHADKILEISNETNPTLVKLGGGAVDLEARVIDTSRGKMVITEITADCRDAMGPTPSTPWPRRWHPSSKP